MLWLGERRLIASFNSFSYLGCNLGNVRIFVVSKDGGVQSKGQVTPYLMF